MFVWFPAENERHFSQSNYKIVTMSCNICCILGEIGFLIYLLVYIDWFFSLDLRELESADIHVL